MNKKDENVEIIKLVDNMSDEDIAKNMQKMRTSEKDMILNLNYFEKSQAQRVLDELKKLAKPFMLFGRNKEVERFYDFLKA